ncbi:M16 family metallopeptidase [Undibacterium squillarum]|uniref:Peptidase M16 n=1 Tax=Undibacterium squillarum TaxID=1131567 RepID=A0ABQ2Y4F7_9BURK|nr:pitrilysin family protein [Undibacterium squillarum]GGX53908.1 peptidase M16 [Undibacterium squillarum]
MKLKPVCFALALAFSAVSAMPALAAAPKASAAAAATAATSVEGITEYRLANGLRVLLAPDASKPTTTVNITYLVGSRHESYGETGMAHLLEHMVFKGTKARGNIMQELSKRGMQFNGTTFYDRTNYYETFPASDDNLQWALEMEADRMVNSRIARSDLDTEFSVVRNEMEIGENNAFRVLWKQLAAVTFDWHNYGHNTIGAKADVEGVKIENLQAFYRKYYQPDNAVLMVAGKFDVKKTLELIEKNFGKLAKPTRQLEKTWTREAPRDGVREVTVRRVTDQQMAAVLYPTSAGSHPDAAAIAAVSHVIGNAPNGRLHKKLVDSKMAVGVGEMPFNLAEPGYAMYLAVLSKDQSMDQAKKVLIETVEGFAKQPVTEEELKLAKTSLLNDIEKTINDPQKLCVAMSESIALGDWRMFFIERDRIEALKLDDVQRVALNYFKEDNRSFGQYIPVAKPERAEIPDTPDVAKLVEGYKGRAAVAAGETFDTSTANIDKRTENTKLANGAKVSLLSKKNRGETVSGAVTLHLGTEQSLMNQSVNMDVAIDMLMRGAGKYSRSEIASRLEELKAKLSVSHSGQNVNISFETVRANLPQLIELMSDVLRRPTFPQAEFDTLQKENLAAIEAQRNEPQAVAMNALKRLSNTGYQPGDIRYDYSLEESLKLYSVAKLEDAKNFYQQFLGADNAEFSIVGDFDNAQVKEALNKAFGDWKAKQAYQRVPLLKAQAKASNETFETPDKANAMYLAVLPLAISDNTAEVPALKVANQILGEGIKSRLFNRLRQKDGISYGAGSQLAVNSQDPASRLLVYAMFAPQNLDKLKTGVKEELERFVKDGITAEELDEAKKAIQQETKVIRAQDKVLANYLRSNANLGRTMKWHEERDGKLQAVTLDQVNAVIRSMIKPELLSHVYAGDFAGAAKKAAAPK